MQLQNCKFANIPPSDFDGQRVAVLGIFALGESEFGMNQYSHQRHPPQPLVQGRGGVKGSVGAETK